MIIRLGRGMAAGLVATLTISMFLILRLSAGVMPWYNPIEIMNLTAQRALGTPSSIFVGWAIHFVVGTLIWGTLFGLMESDLPGGSDTRRGIRPGRLAGGSRSSRWLARASSAWASA